MILRVPFSDTHTIRSCVVRGAPLAVPLIQSPRPARQSTSQPSPATCRGGAVVGQRADTEICSGSNLSRHRLDGRQKVLDQILFLSRFSFRERTQKRCGPMSEQAKTSSNKQERRAQWCPKLFVQAANTKAPLCVHRRASNLLSAHTACQTKRCPFKKADSTKAAPSPRAAEEICSKAAARVRL